MPQYDHPSQFEPLLPDPSSRALVERARDISSKVRELHGSVPLFAHHVVRNVVRFSSAYYSNRIEGDAAHPLDMWQALKGNFSKNPPTARLQRFAVAHIQAQVELAQLEENSEVLFSGLHSDRLIAAHHAIYSRLNKSDRTTPDGREVQPGKFRIEEVAVGHHLSPKASSIPRFLRRMDEVYLGSLHSLFLRVAAAHHRTNWVHPFADGNGRASRLQADNSLLIVSGELWSISRGLAKHRDEYFHWLANADLPRQGDLDGRGNLSLKALNQWCEFFLEVIDEEVNFMSDLLNWEKLTERISKVITIWSWDTPFHEFASEIRRAVIQTLQTGFVGKHQFLQLLNIGEPIGLLVKEALMFEGFLAKTSGGDVSFRFPIDKLDLLLPQFLPEAAAPRL